MHRKQLRKAVEAGVITQAAIVRIHEGLPELGWMLHLHLSETEAYPLTNKEGQVLVFDYIDNAIAELAAVSYTGPVGVAWSMA